MHATLVSAIMVGQANIKAMFSDFFRQIIPFPLYRDVDVCYVCMYVFFMPVMKPM